jgi:hypothetical protein
VKENVMEIFQQMGLSLRNKWRAVNHDNLAFPALATQALEEFGTHTRLTPLALLEWAMDQEELPNQANLDSEFGQPPLTMFRDERFFIDAIFWRTSTTAIHQHSFSGAFQVMSGTCVHAEYAFQARERVNLILQFGEMTVKRLEMLRPGDVRTISLGDRFIHANYHVESPMVTIVIRTHSEPWFTPQYSYLRPGVAWAPFAVNHTRTRREQCLDLLRTSFPERFEQAAAQLVRSDASTAFYILREAFEKADPAAYARLLEVAIDRYGQEMVTLTAALADQKVLSSLMKRRGDASDQDLSFFIGVLAFARNRADVLGLLRERFPDRDPAAVCRSLAARFLEPDIAERQASTQRLMERALELLLESRHSPDEGIQILSSEFGLRPDESPVVAGLVHRVASGTAVLQPLRQ